MRVLPQHEKEENLNLQEDNAVKACTAFVAVSSRVLC